jgi:hypothetical protein
MHVAPRFLGRFGVRSLDERIFDEIAALLLRRVMVSVTPLNTSAVTSFKSCVICAVYSFRRQFFRARLRQVTVLRIVLSWIGSRNEASKAT